MRICFFIFASLLFFASCTYEKMEVPPLVNADTTTVCDTLMVTFTEDIKPLLTTNCGTEKDCHRTDANQSDVPLVTYDEVLIFVGTGQLLSSVTHDGNAAEMPKDGDKLSDCNINKIKAWINQGTVQ